VVPVETKTFVGLLCWHWKVTSSVYVITNIPYLFATNWKVAGSIPDGVTGIFQCLNPSGCVVALRSTQPLTEMSTRNPFCG
jgi:hypothetical protein